MTQPGSSQDEANCTHNIHTIHTIRLSSQIAGSFVDSVDIVEGFGADSRQLVVEHPARVLRLGGHVPCQLVPSGGIPCAVRVTQNCKIRPESRCRTVD